MKKKFLVVIVIISFVIPMTLPILAAMSDSDFNNKLSEFDNIINDVEELRDRYNQYILNYEDVINLLSPETKEKALNLTNKLTDEASITADVNSIIAELEALDLPRATEFVDEIEEIKSDAKTIADECEVLIEDIKNDYSDLSLEQISSLIDKSKEVLVSLGGTIDKTTEYNNMMADIGGVHTSLTTFNNNVKSFSELYEDEFIAIASPDLAKKIMNKLIDQDISEALQEVKKALVELGTDKGGNASNEVTTLINDSTNIKDDITTIADTYMNDYFYFTETQINDVKEEIQNIVDEYIELTNYMIDNFVKPNYTSLVKELYDYEIDTAIDKIDDMIDEILFYETKIKNKKKELIENPSSYIRILALFINTDFDVREYIDSNFGSHIEDLKDDLLEEIDGYIEHIQNSIDAERNKVVENGSSSILTKQADLARETAKNIATKAKIKALENKIKQELTDRNIDNSSINNAITLASDTIHNIYDMSVLTNIEASFKLENTKFTYNDTKKYIIASDFINIDMVTSITGLDVPAFAYNGINSGKVKTKSNMMITMSPKVFEIYTFVVRADINGDGRKNISDVILTIDAALRLNNLDDASLTAADMNSNNAINISDVIMVIDSVLGR
ncbi:MAG: hypothetical protein PHR25_00980 [Clostridia bacterium]|nr:hypothetical protein [Clostridia bacterium]MDD4375341.1 hypothetical protein [Clostridia bacterium]